MGRFLRRALAVPSARRRAIGAIAVAAVATVLGVVLEAPAGRAMPVPVSRTAAVGGRVQVASQDGSFHQIILPDLLLVAPKGLTSQQITRLGKIPGVRNMITFDGAELTADGTPVTVIGVNPSTFRSWVPLRTASDQAFWTALSVGEFVASTSASKMLAFTPGKLYQLVGSTAQSVKFGMAARLDLAGIDLMVNKRLSAKLGLVHQVAGLISAPAVRLPKLTREVTRILGPGGRTETLAGQLPTSSGSGASGSAAAGGRPQTYIQLFEASAKDYCPGLSWTVLAAIGQIESADGANEGPSTAGALGPMQFLPSTWAVWGIDAFGQTGPPNVMDPYDAVPSAARLLCADGAAAGGTSLANAIFGYNHANWYVREVLGLAAQYSADYG